MQILKSGSSVNLDTRETIEQLIFAAKVTANAAVKTSTSESQSERKTV
jgi:hypothetical protein